MRTTHRFPARLPALTSGQSRPHSPRSPVSRDSRWHAHWQRPCCGQCEPGDGRPNPTSDPLRTVFSGRPSVRQAGGHRQRRPSGSAARTIRDDCNETVSRPRWTRSQSDFVQASIASAGPRGPCMLRCLRCMGRVTRTISGQFAPFHYDLRSARVYGCMSWPAVAGFPLPPGRLPG